MRLFCEHNNMCKYLCFQVFDVPSLCPLCFPTLLKACCFHFLHVSWFFFFLACCKSLPGCQIGLRLASRLVSDENWEKYIHRAQKPSFLNQKNKCIEIKDGILDSVVWLCTFWKKIVLWVNPRCFCHFSELSVDFYRSGRQISPVPVKLLVQYWVFCQSIKSSLKTGFLCWQIIIIPLKLLL